MPDTPTHPQQTPHNPSGDQGYCRRLVPGGFAQPWDASSSPGCLPRERQQMCTRVGKTHWQSIQLILPTASCCNTSVWHRDPASTGDNHLLCMPPAPELSRHPGMEGTHCLHSWGIVCVCVGHHRAQQ